MIIFIWENTENEKWNFYIEVWRDQAQDGFLCAQPMMTKNSWLIPSESEVLGHGMTHMIYDVGRVMFRPLRTVIIAVRVKQVINNDQQLLDRNQWHKQLEIITVPDNKSL